MPALLQPFARRRSWVRGACSGICGEGLPEHALRLLRHRLGLLLGAVLSLYASSAAIAAPWLVVLAQQLDKVGGKEPDHAPVTLQPSHPPRAISCIEHFDQVSFYESQVSFRLVSGQRARSRAQRPSQLTSPPHEYTALHQHGNRVGSACPTAMLTLLQATTRTAPIGRGREFVERTCSGQRHAMFASERRCRLGMQTAVRAAATDFACE